MFPGFCPSPRKPGRGEAFPGYQELSGREVILSISLPAYRQIAQRLTEKGFGRYSVTKAREQITPSGRPLTNPDLVAVSFRGQRDWGLFWQVARPTQRAIDEAYRKGKRQLEIDGIVKVKIQEGIQSVATMLRTRKSI